MPTCVGALPGCTRLNWIPIPCFNLVAFLSGGVDVDILPSRASKGKALSFLLKQASGCYLGILQCFCDLAHGSKGKALSFLLKQASVLCVPRPTLQA